MQAYSWVIVEQILSVLSWIYESICARISTLPSYNVRKR